MVREHHFSPDLTTNFIRHLLCNQVPLSLYTFASHMDRMTFHFPDCSLTYRDSKLLLCLTGLSTRNLVFCFKPLVATVI